MKLLVAFSTVVIALLAWVLVLHVQLSNGRNDLAKHREVVALTTQQLERCYIHLDAQNSRIRASGEEAARQRADASKALSDAQRANRDLDKRVADINAATGADKCAVAFDLIGKATG